MAWPQGLYRMRCTQTKSTQKGFTLIEMLVIAPIVVLLISALVVFLVNLTGETLRITARNTMAYEVDNALASIEADATKAISFQSSLQNSAFGVSASNFPLYTPQGYNDLTTGWTTGPDLTQNGKALIIKAPATSTNPLSTTRSLVYLAQPDATCDSATITANDVYSVAHVYFVKNQVLYRRTILGNTRAGICNGASTWQRPSCSQANVASYPSVCKAADEELVHNVSQMSISYYTSTTGTSPITAYTWSNSDATASQRPVSIQVSITTKQNTGTASTNLPSFTGSLRVSSINIR